MKEKEKLYSEKWNRALTHSWNEPLPIFFKYAINVYVCDRASQLSTNLFLDLGVLMITARHESFFFLNNAYSAHVHSAISRMKWNSLSTNGVSEWSLNVI